MNAIQKYQEFIDSFESINKRYAEEISKISESTSIPNDTKEFMISNRMGWINGNNELINELKKLAEKAANF